MKAFIMTKDIDLREAFFLVYKEKLRIFSITIAFFFLSIIYSLSLPNIYKSQVIVVLNEDSSNLSNIASQIGGMSSLAGLSIPFLNTGEKKSDDAIEVLKSLTFFERFINKKDFYLAFSASKGWDKSSGNLILNGDIYDGAQNKWVSNEPFSIDGKPSLQEVYKDFHENNFKIVKDPLTGHVLLSIEHFSPQVAKESIETIIFEMNELEREKDIANAEQSIKFLEEQMLKTNLSEVRIALSSLVQEQVKKVMVAKSSKDYLFSVLSFPYAPEEKDSPQRFVIVSSVTLFSFFLSCLYFVLFSTKKNDLVLE